MLIYLSVFVGYTLVILVEADVLHPVIIGAMYRVPTHYTLLHVFCLKF